MTPVRGRRLRAWLPALLWAATIFVLSSLPGSAYPPTGLVHADKLAHVAVYALLGGLCAHGLARGWTRGADAGVATIVLLAVALATLYGVSDELHQRFVPGRNPDWRDVVADGAGAFLGAYVTAMVARHRRRGGAGPVR